MDENVEIEFVRVGTHYKRSPYSSSSLKEQKMCIIQPPLATNVLTSKPKINRIAEVCPLYHGKEKTIQESILFQHSPIHTFSSQPYNSACISSGVLERNLNFGTTPWLDNRCSGQALKQFHNIHSIVKIVPSFAWFLANRTCKDLWCCRET